MIAFVHPQPLPAPPAYVQVQSVAPNAGAAGTSDSAASSAPSTGQGTTRSDNGGQLASKAVPGGTNKAPVTGRKPESFSKPIK